MKTKTNINKNENEKEKNLINDKKLLHNREL